MRDIKDRIGETATVLYKAKKSYYSKNFYEFNRDVLGWPDIYEPLHRKVCNFITDNVEHKKLLLLLPRGTFKSSMVTVGYSLWRIAKNPNERIMIANATYPMAIQFLGQIKKHLSRNAEFKKLFGDYSVQADQWREDRIFISKDKSYATKEPTISAYGTGGNLTGSHFDIAILDDIVARDNIGTKDQIEKVKNFYKDVLDLVDQDPAGHKRVVVIGTTWHWDDLYSWIQDPDEGLIQDFKVMKLPAYEGEWGEGKLLFPDRLGWKTLEQLKRQQGTYHFHAQYMLNPVPTEDQTFKPPFRYFEETDIKGLDLKKFISVDPAISERKEADYSAMVCIGVDNQNDWYILDLWRDRVQPKRLIEQIFYWYEKWKPISVGIETTAFQKALQYFLIDEMKRRNLHIPTKELGHTDMSKFDRIKGLQPRYETGSVFHPQKNTQPLTKYLEDELLRFPKGKNDDMIDALASQLELAFPPKLRTERSSFKRNIYPA